jgi:WD40 repeat protein
VRVFRSQRREARPQAGPTRRTNRIDRCFAGWALAGIGRAEPRRHDLAAGRRQLVKALEGHTGAVADVRFSPTGERVCAGYGDRHLVSWRTSDWQLEWDVKAHEDGITRTVFSPSGALIATASWDGTARLFNAADGAPLFVLPVGTGAGRCGVLPRWPRHWPPGAGSHDPAVGRGERRLDPAVCRERCGIESLRYADHGQVLLSGGGYPSFRITGGTRPTAPEDAPSPAWPRP